MLAVGGLALVALVAGGGFLAMKKPAAADVAAAAPAPAPTPAPVAAASIARPLR
jgi:hypothetical protein